MPTPTYTPLATVTLGTTAASVTFSSIPATYRDLRIVFSALGTTNDASVEMRFNGDTGSNYTQVYMLGTTSGAASGTYSTTLHYFYIGMGLSTSSVYNPATIDLMDYSATDKHKTSLIRSNGRINDGSMATSALAGRWANTGAITSVAFTPTGGSFATGTTVNLYGIAS
jgi:WD40 repeat protein